MRLPWAVVALRLREREAEPPVAVGNWDYRVHGADWVDGVCRLAQEQLGTAARQSPVNLATGEATDLATSYFFYTYPAFTDAVTLSSTATGFAVTFPDWYKAGFMEAASEDVVVAEPLQAWRLRQLSVHAPGEHTWDGTATRLEVQLMHERPKPPVIERAAVAVPFVQGGKPSAFLATLLEQLPTEPWRDVVLYNAQDWPLGELFKETSFTRYSGSLTEPPCDQGVEWYVRQPIEASPDQLEKLAAAVQHLSPPGNNRAVQPTNGRSFTRIASKEWDEAMKMKGAVGSGATVANILAEAGAAAPPPPEEEPIISADAIVNNAAFSAIFADDSQAIIDAKEKLKQAELEAKSAAANAVSAKSALDTYEELYASTTGWVDKLDMTWNLIFHQQNYAGACAARDAAQAKHNEVLNEVLNTINDEMKSQILQGTPSTTAESFDAATKELLKFRAQLEAGQIALATPSPNVSPTVLPDHQMIYAPMVVPMGGEAANPFNPTVAEAAPRIRAGGQARAYPKLSANLRQPHGPSSVVPQPVLRKIWYDPPDPSANTTNASAAATEPAAESVATATEATALGSVGHNATVARPPKAWWR